jgi:signal transduction histidine kinase
VAQPAPHGHHTHQRQRLEDLVADADRWARTIPAAQVLSQIGSPFAPDQQPVLREELNHAAGTPRKHLADTIGLQELVDDLLLDARLESGSIGPASAPVDLDDLLLDEARRLRQRGLVRVDTSAISAARVLGDPKQLRRAIGNLTSNAERHATTTVTLELRENAEHSVLVVGDDGPGITVRDHATVFQRFTRLDDARSREAGGSGLGLAIVHDIVARHGGTIAITSSDGDGARFVVTLPRID